MLVEDFPVEIGDDEFDLELNPGSDIQRDHPLVGRGVQVSPGANEILANRRGDLGQIRGVVVKHGQVAGFLVDLDGDILMGPKKAFYYDKLFVEDVHLNSPRAQHIRRLMAHWSVQRHYFGPNWDGIEYFHYQLAKAVDWLAVESAGWYDYPSTPNDKLGGKDWRLIIPDDRSYVSVNCHSLVHDGTWSLSTTIFSTRDIDETALSMVGGRDHWDRVLRWTIETARALQEPGINYSDVIADLTRRIDMQQSLQQLSEELRPALARAHEQVFDEEMRWPRFSIGASKIPIGVGKIGVSIAPTDEHDYTIITVHPKAFQKPDYLREVVRHELIHTVIDQDIQTSAHDDVFQAFAAAAGLPEKYRD